MAQFMYLVLIPVALCVQLCASSEHQDEHDFNNESKEEAEEHLKEHLKDMTGDKLDPTKMTARERIIYMFRIHDLDKDNRMDGIELFRIYAETQGRREKQTNNEYEEHIMARVDNWLDRFDFDKDGYVSLAERLMSVNV